VKRYGAPCTISATIANARTVRAPMPGMRSSSQKSEGPRSAAAARLPCSRRTNTSFGRTSWCAGMIRCGSIGCDALGPDGIARELRALEVRDEMPGPLTIAEYRAACGETLPPAGR
jgi:hypothetical protein